MGSGCGAVNQAVASKTRRLEIESSHQHLLTVDIRSTEWRIDRKKNDD